MIEDAPPKDMNGVDENPDSPHAVGVIEPPVVPVGPVKPPPPAPYPVELSLRPITLPQNMIEIGIAPHFAFDAPITGPTGSHLEFMETDALRARYGITRQIQLGLTYEYGGIYKNLSNKTTFNAGKAVGLDLTVLLQNWVAIQIGVPIYLDPGAVALTIAIPLKFSFGDKFALGALDDLLSIKLDKFAPSFYYQANNEGAAATAALNTQQSNGDLRFSLYGIYQQQRNLAIVGRIGVDLNDLGSATTQTFLRAFLQWSPIRAIDLGVGLGFDDLAHGGTFGPDFLIRGRL